MTPLLFDSTEEQAIAALSAMAYIAAAGDEQAPEERRHKGDMNISDLDKEMAASGVEIVFAPGYVPGMA